MAGVALGDIHRHFGVAGVALLGLGWLRWRARAAVDVVVAAAVCVAGVALGDIGHTFVAHANPSPSLFFPAFPIPSLPFFCQLLEEVDMWGYPVLLLNQ